MDLRLIFIVVGDPDARRDASSSQDGKVEVVSGHGRRCDRPDEAQLVPSDQSTDRNHAKGPRTEEARDGHRVRDDGQSRPRRQGIGELLGGRTDPHEDGAIVFVCDQARRRHADQPLLAGMLQRARVEPEIEGSRQVGARPAVGPTQETISFESGDVPADRHLGDAEERG